MGKAPGGLVLEPGGGVGRHQPHLVRLEEAAAATPQDPNLRRRHHCILGPDSRARAPLHALCSLVRRGFDLCSARVPLAPRHRAVCACVLRSCSPQLGPLLALVPASPQHGPMRVRPALRPTSAPPPACAASPLASRASRRLAGLLGTSGLRLHLLPFRAFEVFVCRLPYSLSEPRSLTFYP